ncbi:MAG: coenzyme F420-0:L-glutamate ligase [Nitrosopumilus sp.]|nr:coenzyme F420-0:L-glutamate ligase [Nitrosopumilus sp.]MDH3501762.1 coenzyme F420-0:L-glutamate ligase [Nitrosopumilus sp.]
MNVLPVYINKEIEPADDVVELIVNSVDILDGDILVIAQKIISKQEGQTVDLSSITPSLLAEGISSQYQKDPRVVELILRESKKIVRMRNGIIIVETNHGFVCANAGIDESNVPNGYATLLPKNPDASAKSIQKKVFDKTKKSVAVIIADTFGRPFRMGQTNSAIGISGITPILDYTGTLDSFNNVLRVTAIAVADEICGAAELVMKKTTKCPVTIIRGYDFSNNSCSVDTLIRPEHNDLFR